jgi:hypothetical protein
VGGHAHTNTAQSTVEVVIFVVTTGHIFVRALARCGGHPSNWFAVVFKYRDGCDDLGDHASVPERCYCTRLK